MWQNNDYTTRVSSPLPPDKKPPRTVPVWFVAIFAVIGLLVGAVIILSVELYRANETTSKPQEPAPTSTPARTRSTPVQTPTPQIAVESTPPPPPPAPVLQNHSIVNDAFAVGAGQYVYYRFSLPRQARVVGTFHASGGHNDIICGVMDEIGFENFANGHPIRGPYWSDGYVTTDRVDITLAPGNYYVVFSNKAALITNKVVKADFSAEY